MIYRVLCAILMTGFLMGCSTQKKELADGEPCVAAPTVGKDASNPFPLSIEIQQDVKKKASDGVWTMVRIVPDMPLPNPELEFLADDSEGLVWDENKKAEALNAIREGKAAEIPVKIVGTKPYVKVRVLLGDRTGQGSMGMMVSSEWPEKKELRKAEPVMKALPAPIEIEGVEVDRGVEVRP